MKLLSTFLAAYLVFLSVHTFMVKAETVEALPMENICGVVCTADDEMTACGNEPASKEDDTCFPKNCNRPCSPCACGIYCFCCVLQTPYASPNAAETSFNLNTTDGIALISNYHTDCFRPPETV